MDKEILVQCKKCNTYLPGKEAKDQHGLCTTCYVKDLNKRLGTGDDKNGNKNK